jgi:hypothetical protein
LVLGLAKGRKMKNDPDNTIHNRKGRPGKFEQLQIEKKLQTLFVRGLNSYSAAIKTSYSINTVKKYYSNFYQKIRYLEGPEFDQACKNRKILTCSAIDEQLLKMEKMQTELEQKSQTGKIQYIQLCKLRISLSNSISNLHMKKLSIANSPTYDEMLTALKKVDEQK